MCPRLRDGFSLHNLSTVWIQATRLGSSPAIAVKNVSDRFEWVSTSLRNPTHSMARDGGANGRMEDEGGWIEVLWTQEWTGRWLGGWTSDAASLAGLRSFLFSSSPASSLGRPSVHAVTFSSWPGWAAIASAGVIAVRHPWFLQ